MKSLIIFYSYHHNNTKKIAEVLARALNAKVRSAQNTSPEKPQRYDLVGFGSGIDSGKHHKVLLDLVDRLPQVNEKKAFVFSTAGMPSNKFHLELKNKLQAKGYLIVDEFVCKGFNTNSFLKLFGGINRGRPNAEDLKHAEDFAMKLRGQS